MNTTDSNLQESVLTELRWEPSVDAAEIGVTADDHVITLQVADGSVRHRRILVPVCRTHATVYRRWGALAEVNAGELWDWS